MNEASVMVLFIQSKKKTKRNETKKERGNSAVEHLANMAFCAVLRFLVFLLLNIVVVCGVCMFVARRDDL